MTTSAKKAGIVQFAGEGFDTWKFRVETQLAAHGVKAILSEDPPAETATAEVKKTFTEKDDKAKALLVTYVADSHLEYVREKQTAKAMWESLNNTFSKKGFASQTFIRRSLALLRMDEGTALSDHFRRFDELIRQLKDAGATVTELDQVSQLFISLPGSYDVVTTAMENLSDDQLKLDVVKARLLAEEQKRSGRNSEISSGPEGIGLATKSKKEFTGRPKFSGKCHGCGAFGHKKVVCPKVRKDRARAQAAGIPIDREVALVSSCEARQKESCRMEWILDSGASRHMVNEEKFFTTSVKLPTPVTIDSAKNTASMEGTREGVVRGKVSTESGPLSLKISKVLFVPHLQFNLLSVAALLKVGVHVEFKPDRAILSKSGETIGEAMMEGNLFYLSMDVQSNAALATHVEGTSEMDLWHRRFAHLGHRNVTKLQQMDMVDGMKLDIKSKGTFCETCAESKLVRLPFNGSRPATTRPLERVHTDVCGKITPATHDGFKYFASFVDDYTHFAVVYLMKTKDQLFDYFKVYEAMATAKFGVKVEKIRCDLGREYFSNQQLAYYEQRGIQVESTVGYTPQQNGVAERFNRTVTEKMRALLVQSGAPKSLWGEAVLNAVYVANRSPTEVLKNKTPAEMWHGVKPKVENLRVFGCVAYSWIPKQKRSKLDPTGQRCVMLGYAPCGYRLWNLTTRKQFVARDVRFNEDDFPFKTAEKVEANTNREIPLVVPQVQQQEGEEQDVAVVLDGDAEVDHTEEAAPLAALPEVHPDDDTEQSEDDFFMPEEAPDDLEEGASALPPQLERDNSQYGTTPRQSGRECRKPGWFKDFLMSYGAFSAVDHSPQVPECYNEIDGHRNQSRWLEAVGEELQALEKNQTWIVVQKPESVVPVPCKWIFTLKTDADGRPIRYKARLVAKGCVQRKGIDYEETFAPVAKLNTIRTILAIANTRGLEVHQMDVRTAFLYGKLEEEVYMQVPDGVRAKPGSVCLLKRSLYGLKQSPRCWNTRFNRFLEGQGFIRSRYDYCLYVKQQGGGTVYIVVYVDDLLIVAKNLQAVTEIKKMLKQEFDMADMNELHDFLGIKIQRDHEQGIIRLSQTGLIEKILHRFGMSDCKPCQTPAETRLQLKRSGDRCEHPYRELIGCLMYLMMGTRPDLCFIVGYLSRFQDTASLEHWQHAKRVLRYIQGTRHLELIYRCSPKKAPVVGFVDADYANDEEDRKCVSGFLLKVFGCTVAWSSKKQSSVAMSSTEAEYIAMSSCISESIWLSGLMGELAETKFLYPVPIFEDNQGAIAMAQKEETKRAKHIDIKYHFIRDAVSAGRIQLVYVPTTQQEADILTKSLAAPSFLNLRNKLGLELSN